MKKQKTLKAFVLSLAMALVTLLPMTTNAQRSDGFFKSGNDEYENRAGIDDTTGGGLQNDPFGAPLGSGLLILTAVGAGYAVAKRRRSFKKGTTLLLAALMLVGMTACKKKVAEPIAPTGGNKVAITLNVDGGAKAVVTPPSVAFENGDQILVASNGHYVGTLTHNGTNFNGDITDPVVGEPLYFYFLGNKATGTLTPGTSGSTSCTVDIIDQTDYPHLPVISMGVSIDRAHGNAIVNYTTDNHEYEAQLHNKASLIKFNVTTPSTSPIYLTGMYNTVTVNFADLTTNDGFSYSNAGYIKMKAKDAGNVTWAIVLPQADLTGAGDTYTTGYSGTWDKAAVNLTDANQYITGDGSGIALTMNTENSRILDLSTVKSNKTVEDGWIVTNALSGNYKISIAAGATVTLDDATITYASNGADWAGLTCEGDATIVLGDGTTNTVVSGLDGSGNNNWPGIYVPTGKTLTINGNTGTLNARCGQDSYGGSAAGIGCGFSSGSDCGNIIINGGVINAYGGAKSAGIGGVNKRSCGNITINGGTVTAIGDYYGSDTGYGAGIGTGGSIVGTATVTCGDITITGGTVTATGGRGAAGIGTGHSGQSVAITCGNITISGGTVIATGGGDADLGYEGAAAIGTGNKEDTGTADNKCGNITITTGVTRVTATKGSSNADNSIGTSGSNNTCGTITIGGVVTGNISTSPYTYEP